MTRCNKLWGLMMGSRYLWNYIVVQLELYPTNLKDELIKYSIQWGCEVGETNMKGLQHVQVLAGVDEVHRERNHNCRACAPSKISSDQTQLSISINIFKNMLVKGRNLAIMSFKANLTIRYSWFP